MASEARRAETADRTSSFSALALISAVAFGRSASTRAAAAAVWIGRSGGRELVDEGLGVGLGVRPAHEGLVVLQRGVVPVHGGGMAIDGRGVVALVLGRRACRFSQFLRFPDLALGEMQRDLRVLDLGAGAGLGVRAFGVVPRVGLAEMLDQLADVVTDAFDLDVIFDANGVAMVVAGGSGGGELGERRLLAVPEVELRVGGDVAGLFPGLFAGGADDLTDPFEHGRTVG